MRNICSSRYYIFWIDLIDTNFLQSLSRMSICLSQKNRWQMKLSRDHRFMTFSSSVSTKRSDLLFESIINLTRRRQRNYLLVLQLRLSIQLLFSCDSKSSSIVLWLIERKSAYCRILQTIRSDMTKTNLWERIWFLSRRKEKTCSLWQMIN